MLIIHLNAFPIWNDILGRNSEHEKWMSIYMLYEFTGESQHMLYSLLCIGFVRLEVEAQSFPEKLPSFLAGAMLWDKKQS